jgi:hypothetical protein
LPQAPRKAAVTIEDEERFNPFEAPKSEVGPRVEIARIPAAELVVFVVMTTLVALAVFFTKRWLNAW